MTTKKDGIWDECEDVIETCRMSLAGLRELVRTAADVRAAGSCQCGDDEACAFVRQREELRKLLALVAPLAGYMPPSLFSRVQKAIEDGVELDGGWVKTKDRLPDCGDAVLALTKCEGYQVLSLSSVARPSEWVGMGHMSWRLAEVSHWKPLPKPPKYEGKE